MADAESVRKDAAHWIDLKQHLPQEVQDMERDYKAIRAVDLAAATAAVQKAGTDWPEKKSDLESRLAMRAPFRRTPMNSGNPPRTRAAPRLPTITRRWISATLFAAADTLKTGAADLPRQADQLKTLSAPVLQVLGQNPGRYGDPRHRQCPRVRPEDQDRQHHLADATGKAGTTTSDEKWVDVSRAQYQAMEKDLGMAIEHKPAGKYDTESERVAQPAGFAYMAPPGQSNQYGHWEQQSDGTSFWVFYGQYALMRDLLFNHSYRPLDYREYHDYYTYRQRNETYYGRDTATQAPKYGTAGTATQERYSGSTFRQERGLPGFQVCQ